MLLLWRKIHWSIKFNLVVCYNKSSKYPNEITIDELQSPLLVHERIIQQDKEKYYQSKRVEL